jgi:hypothetical protein
MCEIESNAPGESQGDQCMSKRPWVGLRDRSSGRFGMFLAGAQNVKFVCMSQCNSKNTIKLCKYYYLSIIIQLFNDYIHVKT